MYHMYDTDLYGLVPYAQNQIENKFREIIISHPWFVFSETRGRLISTSIYDKHFQYRRRVGSCYRSMQFEFINTIILSSSL